MKDIYLIAIEPPGNIQRDYYLLQKRLFQTLGFSSARALPPLIPLGWISRPTVMAPPGKIRGRSSGTLRIPGAFRSEERIEIRNDTVHVPISLPENILSEAGYTENGQSGGEGPDGSFRGSLPEPFPIPRGILIAAEPGIDKYAREIARIPPPPPRIWRRAELTEISIHYTVWGYSLSWEYGDIRKIVCTELSE